MSRFGTGRGDRGRPDPGRPDPEPDRDIAALFDAQADAQRVPPGLDDSVRAAVRAATANATAARAPGASRPGRTRLAPPRWLAVAAVLVLAVAIVPLLTRQAPDLASDSARQAFEPQALEERGGAAADDAAEVSVADDAGYEIADTPADEEAPAARTAPERKARPVPLPAPRAAVAPAAGGSAGRVVVESAAESAASSPAAERAVPPVSVEAEAAFVTPVTPAPTDAEPETVATARDSRALSLGPSAGLERARPAESDRGEASADTDAADHRRTPEAWLAWLRERLRADGLTDELHEEFERFRERHPRFEPGFDPEEEARPGERERR